MPIASVTIMLPQTRMAVSERVDELVMDGLYTVLTPGQNGDCSLNPASLQPKIPHA